MRGDPPSPPSAPPAYSPSTPHARGSTPGFISAVFGLQVYPACAGIHPPFSLSHCSVASLPRMRGDPPDLSAIGKVGIMSTPHARGSTATLSGKGGRKNVYPACAGIHPFALPHAIWRGRLPRMRGDPPADGYEIPQAIPSTPHARGSTWK